MKPKAVTNFFSFCQVWYFAYYHFVIEALPRVMLARQLLNKDPLVKLVVPSLWSYIPEVILSLSLSQVCVHCSISQQFLSLLGIPKNRLVLHANPGRVLQADELYVTQYTPIFRPSQSGMFAVRAAILTVSSPPPILLPFDLLTTSIKGGQCRIRKYQRHNDSLYQSQRVSENKQRNGIGR